MNILNRDLARAERATEEEAQMHSQELETAEAVIAQLQREKAALRQALYEQALELADARVAAAMQNLRALDAEPEEETDDDE